MKQTSTTTIIFRMSTRALDWLARFCMACASVLLLLIVVIVGLQVLTRTAGAPLIWTQEAALYALVWLTFLGAVALARERGHIGLDMPIQTRRPALRKAWIVSVQLATASTCAVLGFGGFLHLESLGAGVSPALRISMTWLFASAVLGFSLWSLNEFANLFGLGSTNADEQRDIDLSGGV